MLSAFTKVTVLLMTVLPVLEKILPSAQTLADSTLFKWDDKLVKVLNEFLSVGKKLTTDTPEREDALIHVGEMFLAKGQSLGLTVEETLAALDDGLKLQARAKQIKFGIRQQLKTSPVVLGDRTLTSPADLKTVPKTTFRLLAEAEYNQNKIEAAKLE